MPYVTSVERLATEKGVQQGLQQGVQQGTLQMARDAMVEVLTARFGPVPAATAERIYAINDVVRLRVLLRHAGTAASLADFEQQL